MNDRQFLAKVKDDHGEIWIYDDIGESAFGGGISAKRFAEELKPIRNSSRVSVYMNSPGGNVFEGIAILNSLKRLGGQKTVYVDGLAASIASVIAMAGDKIVMAENAQMMIHNPWIYSGGEAKDHRKLADELDRIRELIANTYASRATIPLDRIHALMDAETWMGSAEAMEYGLADSVTDAKNVMASWMDLSRFKNAPRPAITARRNKLAAMKQFLFST